MKKIIRYIINQFLPIEKQAIKAGVKIGNGNLFGSKFWSTEPYLITIGNNCQITNGVKIFTHGGAHILRNTDPDFDIFGKVIIKDWVYIDNNSLIMPGVTIENNSLIAAGSVVTKSVPPRVVVGGNPAKIICSVEEYYIKNKKYNIRTKRMNHTKKKETLMSLSDVFLLKKEYLKYE